jgi:hypothetical protein
MTTATRTLRVGEREIPVVFPSVRDARLQTAAVIISIHAIGILFLGFRVSVPHILSAIATAGLIDVFFTYRGSGKLVWPASGMLTGSGVALILRLVAMESGDYWSWTGWYWYALVAGVSLLTKYVIKYKKRHVFNPSNIGLVAAFVVIGSGIVEPLDFWWAPLGPPMLLAYVLIIGGGILITRRLYLLEMATAYWVVLSAGLAVLAASGHCMIATWSATPVCGGRFWTTLVTSPEVLIFLFFMITDPKTVPSGRAGRVSFAITLGLATTLLIAPHTVEYGAKVGLLASLALWSPLRVPFDRAFPSEDLRSTGMGQVLDRLSAARPGLVFARGTGIGALVGILAGAIILAGIPARTSTAFAVGGSSVVPIVVDVPGLPEPIVEGSVTEVALDVDGDFLDALVLNFSEDLALEAEAIRTADGSLLGLAAGGERLTEMQARLDAAIADGSRRADHYTFETLTLGAHEAIGQVSAGLVFTGTGTVDRVVYDTDGNEVSRSSEPFDDSFVLRQIAGERWLIVQVAPAGE